MDIFSKRPLFISCMMFLACSIVGYFISGDVKKIIILLIAVAIIFSIILAIFRYHSAAKKYVFLIFILCLVMMISAFTTSYSFFDRNYERFSDQFGTEQIVSGTIVAIEYENSYSSAYTVHIDEVNGESENFKARLEFEYTAALEIGEGITVVAVASEPQNTGKYNEKLSLMSDGIFVIYTSDDESGLIATRSSEGKDAMMFFANINNELSSILRRTVGGDAGDLSSALFLGNKHLLSDTITRDFRRVGASHFLALSGLHMSLVMGAVMLLLKRTIRNRTYISVILSCIALFYLALTGFSVSATRSVIMLLMVYLSFLISGLPDSLTSLSISGVIIVLFSPGALVDAGFWMSFAATLGILVYMSPVNEYFNNCLSKYDNKIQFIYHKVLFSVISSIVTSLAAIMPLIIVTCIFIKEISVFSILSSVVLSIPTAIIIVSTLILLPLYWIPHISTAIVFFIRCSSDIMINYCSKISEYENIVISLNYPFASIMAVILAIALFFSFASKKFNPFISLIPFALCISIFIGLIWAYENVNMDNLKVSYVNTSSNSDIIVLSNEREAVICDVSNGSQTSYQHALYEVAKARATEIKAIMLTRYTYQHNATLYKVFQNYKVREIWIPYPKNTEEYNKMETLYDFAMQNNVSVYVYKDGETMRPFDHSYIDHKSAYIERSSVPIDLLGVYTGKEHLTYVSPAFNESELIDEAEFAFSKSHYIILGCRGPKAKSFYSIEDTHKLKSITFSNKRLIALYNNPEFSFSSNYLVSKGEIMDYYLKE